jgi:hypothetical protein
LVVQRVDRVGEVEGPVIVGIRRVKTGGRWTTQEKPRREVNRIGDIYVLVCVGVRPDKAQVAHISPPVRVGVQLVLIGRVRAVDTIVRPRVRIAVDLIIPTGADVANVTNAVTVTVPLVRGGNRETVVATVGHAVGVAVGQIVRSGANVTGVGHGVHVAVDRVVPYTHVTEVANAVAVAVGIGLIHARDQRAVVTTVRKRIQVCVGSVVKANANIAVVRNSVELELDAAFWSTPSVQPLPHVYVPGLPVIAAATPMVPGSTLIVTSKGFGVPLEVVALWNMGVV